MRGMETKETLLYKSAGLIGGYVAGMEDVKGGITQKDIDRVRKMTAWEAQSGSGHAKGSH